MQMSLAHVGSVGGSRDAFDATVTMYLERCSGWAKCSAQSFRNEAALLEWMAKQSGRTQVVAVLLDSRGKGMSSEAFAAWLGARRDEGAQHIVFAVGPADGWSAAARERAQMQLSLGPMTLAHGLARVVIAEQIYRAVTILTGHPYHSGH